MVEKRVKKFGQGPPPPFSGNARKKSIFLWEVFPKHQRSLWKMSKTCLPRVWLFATVHEGAAETGQGREEELVALVRYIREVWSETWGSHLCQAGTVPVAV